MPHADVGRFLPRNIQLVLYVVSFLALAVSGWYYLDECNSKQYRLITQELEARNRNLTERCEGLTRSLNLVREDNARYLRWLESAEGTFPALEARLIALERGVKNKVVTRAGASHGAKPEQEQVRQDEVNEARAAEEGHRRLYSRTENVGTGRSYNDQRSGVVVGINSIDSDLAADLTLSFPNGETEYYNRKRSGWRLLYTYGRTPFGITLSGVDWATGVAQITIQEMSKPQG